jgi:tRNA(adenine34) deaminase
MARRCAEISRQAREFWQSDWQSQTLMAIGLQDPVLGEVTMRALQANIAGCPESMLIAQGGHIVQEHGDEIARRAIAIWS